MLNPFPPTFQGLHSRKLQNGKFSDEDDVPSAPPFGGSTQEIKVAAESSPASKVHGTPKAADLPEAKNTTIKPKDKGGNGKSDQFVRSVLLFLYFEKKKNRYSVFINTVLKRHCAMNFLNLT